MIEKKKKVKRERLTVQETERMVSNAEKDIHLGKGA